MLATVPQTNPRANYLAHQAEIDAAITRVLESGQFILGQEVSQFESEFARYLGLGHAIGVGSGTDALTLALRACEIGPGDAVVTVSHTAVATVAAIELAGAMPILVDVDPISCTLDCAALTAAMRQRHDRRIKAVIPVHLYGHPVEMRTLLSLAREFDWRIIEDCAQAHGAALGGRKVGTWGDVAAFSFYPTKNLAALGDGGAVTTNDSQLADRVRMLREYGWRERYVSDVPGVNSRLDELQAAILRVKLRHLDADNERRQVIAARYQDRLAAAGFNLPTARPDATHVFHQFVIRTPRRDAIRAALRTQGIGTLVHYPVPVHLQPAYQGRVETLGQLRVTESLVREILSLPMFPEMAEDQVDYVVQALAEA